jgi:hypothetical protein
MEHTLFLSSIEYNKIFGHSTASITVMDKTPWILNESVEIFEKDYADNQGNPISVVRYVVAVQLIGNDYGECPIWFLHLSPFKNDRSRLGLSRVRNSDNL